MGHLALTLVLLALGFFPLLGGPRYEAALLGGFVASPWLLVLCAHKVRKQTLAPLLLTQSDKMPRAWSLGGACWTSFGQALLGALVLLLVAFFHGARLGFCEPLEGFCLLLLGPSLGVIFASAVAAPLGALSALLRPQPTRTNYLLTSAAALSLFLVSAGLSVLGFYRTPVVSAYEPFVGYFAGPLYDAPAFELGRLLSYRVGTMALAGALFCLTSALRISSTEKTGPRLSWAVGPGGATANWTRVGLLVSLTAVSLGVANAGPKLGHRQSAASIARGLGRQTTHGLCRVHFSREVRASSATRIARECEAHLDQLSRYFDIQVSEPVHVYLFANSEQKRRWIGAGRTNVAKPWRREIYIRVRAFPHPVIGHELAHVVAGQFAGGPFRVAGPLAGWIADPGRIEGFAEAAAPRERSLGTVHEWAAAMRKLDLLPPVADLFRLGFLGASAARSYTTAGSFVDYLKQSHGAEALRAWYGGSSLRQSMGADLPELERAWHAFLDSLEVPQAVEEAAQPRFSRPGVFGRRCPHAVDRKAQEVLSVCGVQAKKARRLIDQIIDFDPAQLSWRLFAPLCDYQEGDQRGAKKELRTLLADTEHYSPQERARGWERAGDWEQVSNAAAAAKTAYEQALQLTSQEDPQRQLELKLWALDKPPVVTTAVFSLLSESAPADFDAAESLLRWQLSGPTSAVAAYLLSRRALFADRAQAAALYSDQFEPKQLPLPSLRKEAARTQLLIACRNGSPALSRLKANYLALELTAAQRMEAERLSERCKFLKPKE